MEPLARVIVRNRPDVAINAKDFLDQNDGPTHWAAAFGEIRLKFVPVVGGEFYVCTHLASICAAFAVSPSHPVSAP